MSAEQAPAATIAPRGALAGIRMLNLSRVLAGPWAGQLLGDLGADVIKVERPDAGDDTRAWGPPYLRDTEGMRPATQRITSAPTEQVGLPCGPINSLDEVFADLQVRARGLQIEMEHSVGDSIPLVANPIRMSGTPVQYRRAPPLLGEHTHEVLADVLGMGAANIDALKAKGVVG